MTPRAHLTGLLACLTALALLALPAARAQGLKLTPGVSGAPALTATPALTTPAPAAGSASQSADYIVAIVNSEPITNNEVRERLARVIEQNSGQTLPPREQLMNQVLERLITERIQVQLAQEAGIKVDDYAVDQAEQSVAQQNGVSVEQLHRQLAQEGVTPERFRRELREQLLILRIRERDVESRVRVTDQDIDAYLRDEAQGTAADTTQINLAQILIEVPEHANDTQVAEREARAREVLARVKSGTDFAALAREYSDAPEGRNGGALGLRPLDRYPALFVNATRSTPVGDVVGPLRSPAGWHILRVQERTRGGAPAIAIQSHARHILLRVGNGVTEAEAAHRLEELRQRITSGQASFEALAREYSQDASSKDGGDLGWAYSGRFVPEFQQALDRLQPGQVSEPVVTRFGVHLIELVERREAQLTQREQRDLARNAVREKKLDEAYANWMREQRARAYVELRDPPQ